MNVRLAFRTTLALVALTVLATQASAQLPDPGIEIDYERIAVVITDPQNDFLSPDGVTWGVVGESVTENNTVANIEALLTREIFAGAASDLDKILLRDLVKSIAAISDRAENVGDHMRIMVAKRMM